LFLLSVAGVLTGVPAVSFFRTAFAFSVLFVLGLLLGGESEKVLLILFVWVPIIVMFALAAIVLRLLWLEHRGKGRGKLQARPKLHELLCCAVGVLAFLICLPLSGFVGEAHSLEQIVRYLIDRGIITIFKGLPAAFQFRLSNINPADRSAIVAEVLLTYSIAAGLVGFLWEVYKRRFDKMQFQGTVQECYWKCEKLLDRDTLQLRREARLQPLGDQSATKVEPLSPDDFVPVVAFLDSLWQRDFEWRNKNANGV
jgi:hypothetical protein